MWNHDFQRMRSFGWKDHRLLHKNSKKPLIKQVVTFYGEIRAIMISSNYLILEEEKKYWICTDQSAMTQASKFAYSSYSMIGKIPENWEILLPAKELRSKSIALLMVLTAGRNMWLSDLVSPFIFYRSEGLPYVTGSVARFCGIMQGSPSPLFYTFTGCLNWLPEISPSLLWWG